VKLFLLLVVKAILGEE